MMLVSEEIELLDASTTDDALLVTATCEADEGIIPIEEVSPAGALTRLDDRLETLESPDIALLRSEPTGTTVGGVTVTPVIVPEAPPGGVRRSISSLTSSRTTDDDEDELTT
jgi:hypothetical protein